jgi:putative transposase
MARFARIVMPGVPCHITQRGNNQQDVFFVDDDRRVYMELLQKAAEQFGLTVHGYCLMTSHVHLVATPIREDSLAKAVGRTHLAYAQYVNRLHGRSGHLWQNRFYSCLLDEDHYWAALRYVERNPVRARIVRLPWRYPWSSAACHTGRGEPTGLLDVATWRREASPKDWEDVLTEADDEEMVRLLRIHTHTGQPLASDSFMSKVETFLGRRVRPLPVGRQRGWRKVKEGKAAGRC